MEQYIVMAIVGAILCVFGIMNFKGNLSTIKWHQRKNVTEENKAVYGKLMGGGTLACGGGVLLGALFFFLADASQYQSLYWVGIAFCIIGAVIGVGLSVYATLKYNKGFF